jgi:glycosyltransferase involved in cell wall biosynthesis
LKILYIHQYFVTPDEYGATRSYWFSRKLIEHGHEVVVITALSSTTKRQPGKYDIDGIKVIYIGGRYNNLQSKVVKISQFLRFLLMALYYAFREKHIDLVYATSTPLTVGALALLYNKLSRVKYIFEVRDLWPEFPIQIGAIKNSHLIKLLRKLERSIYKNAMHIVALSPGMKEGIMSTGIDEVKVTIIPNMSKPDLFYPREKSALIFKEYNINPNNFNIIHFGSMGKANGLEFIVEAAKELKKANINDVTFVMAGYGSTEALLKKSALDNHLENIIFTGKHNTFIMSELVNCCDACLVSFRKLPILTTNSPNKLFDGLSAGKPIIVNSTGWTKDLVEQSECGFYVDPENPADIVTKLLKYKSDNELLSKWSANARNLSLTAFDKTILSKQYVDLIEKVEKENRE